MFNVPCSSGENCLLFFAGRRPLGDLRTVFDSQVVSFPDDIFYALSPFEPRVFEKAFWVVPPAPGQAVDSALVSADFPGICSDAGPDAGPDAGLDVALDTAFDTLFQAEPAAC